MAAAVSAEGQGTCDLIIAEKHSVAQAIADALGGVGQRNGDGCIETGNNIVT